MGRLCSGSGQARKSCDKVSPKTGGARATARKPGTLPGPRRFLKGTVEGTEAVTLRDPRERPPGIYSESDLTGSDKADKLVKRLEKLAGVSFDRQAREAIGQWVNFYRAIEENTHTPVQIREHLRKIKKRARELADLIGLASSGARQKQLKIAALHSSPRWDNIDFVETLANLLLKLAAECEFQSRGLKATPGRRKLATWRALIAGLHEIWAAAGGERLGAWNDAGSNKPTGPFFGFVQELLYLAGKDYKTGKGRKPATLLDHIKKSVGVPERGKTR